MKNSDINLDLNTIKKEAKGILSRVQKYTIVLFVVVIVGLWAFLILTISGASQQEPSESEVLEGLGSVKRLKIDEDSVAKIQELEEQSIEVRALFEDARKNPFLEGQQQ